MNIAAILEKCPKGTKLYTPLIGEVFLDGIDLGSQYPIRVTTKDSVEFSFTANGRYLNQYLSAECMLFPSKENRDWSTFKVEKLDLPKGTPVMVTNRWSNCEDFSLRHYAGDKKCYPYGKKQGWPVYWKVIIPFDKFNPNNIEESLKHKL